MASQLHHHPSRRPTMHALAPGSLPTPHPLRSTTHISLLLLLLLLVQEPPAGSLVAPHHDVLHPALQPHLDLLIRLPAHLVHRRTGQLHQQRSHH